MVGSTERSPYFSPRLARTPWSGRGTAARLSVAARSLPQARRAARRSSSADRAACTVRPASALVRNGSGQPPGGSPSSPLRKPITESGMSNFAGLGLELGRVGADRDQVQREVADHLGRRRHLDDVAEDVVGRGVHVLDLLELLAEAERDRLLAQVGELAAGDLVAVDAAGRRRQPGLERRVDPAGRPPSRARGRRPPRSVSPVARSVWSVAATSADSARLRGGAGHRRAAPRRPRPRPASIAASSVASWPPGVSWVCRCTGRSNRSRSARDQGARGRRAQQPGHVLDREHVRAGVDDPLGEAAGSSRACRASRPGRTGRRCSRARPRRPSCRSRAPPRSPAASARRR